MTSKEAKAALDQAKKEFKANPTPKNRTAVEQASQRYQEVLLEEAKAGRA